MIRLDAVAAATASITHSISEIPLEKVLVRVACGSYIPLEKVMKLLEFAQGALLISAPPLPGGAGLLVAICSHPAVAAS